MTDYNDGQLHIWHGGERPVHRYSKVNLWFRASFKPAHGIQADETDWSHDGTNGDIILFQVLEQYQCDEAVKTVKLWGNLWDGSFGKYWVVHPSKEIAKSHSERQFPQCIRAVVPFYEVTNIE